MYFRLMKFAEELTFEECLKLEFNIIQEFLVIFTKNFIPLKFYRNPMIFVKDYHHF